MFTPRQWLERYRQFAKREHKTDITLLIKGEEVIESGWSGKEKLIQEDSNWGVGQETLYQISQVEKNGTGRKKNGTQHQT